MNMDGAPVKALGKLFLWQNHKPSYILFFVTGRCEAACKHCFYWRKRNVQEQELTLAEIETFARKCGPVVQLTLTGGSPELRGDLADIARVFWTSCRPLNITLCSNGNNPDKLAHDVRSIVMLSPDCNLTVDISLDGLHEEHDTLRGVKGLFDRVLRSYEQLRIIRERHANLRIGCGLCVSGMNKHTALATARWAMEHLPLDNFTPILVRGKPQHPDALETDSGVFLAIADEVARRLHNGSFPGYVRFAGIVNRKDVIQKRLIASIYRTRRSPVRCSAARETAVIYPDGTVAACELRDDVLGSLRTVAMDIGAIWRSRSAHEFRTGIRTERCTCWHQCFLSPTIVKSPTLWLSSIRHA